MHGARYGNKIYSFEQLVLFCMKTCSSLQKSYFGPGQLIGVINDKKKIDFFVVVKMIVLVVVSILMPTSQSEAAGEAGLGWWGALREAAAAAEILKSTGRSGS